MLLRLLLCISIVVIGDLTAMLVSIDAGIVVIIRIVLIDAVLVLIVILDVASVVVYY